MNLIILYSVIYIILYITYYYILFIYFYYILFPAQIIAMTSYSGSILLLFNIKKILYLPIH